MEVVTREVRFLYYWTKCKELWNTILDGWHSHITSSLGLKKINGRETLKTETEIFKKSLFSGSIVAVRLAPYFTYGMEYLHRFYKHFYEFLVTGSVIDSAT